MTNREARSKKPQFLRHSIFAFGLSFVFRYPSFHGEESPAELIDFLAQVALNALQSGIDRRAAGPLLPLQFGPALEIALGRDAFALRPATQSQVVMIASVAAVVANGIHESLFGAGIVAGPELTHAFDVEGFGVQG